MLFLPNPATFKADHLWSARLLHDDPRLIYDAHLQYLHAGADFAMSASYQATIAGFERAGVDTKEAGMLIRKSVRLAVEARDAAWKQIQADPNSASRIRPLVAASVGSYGASLADGSEYRGDYNVTLVPDPISDVFLFTRHEVHVRRLKCMYAVVSAATPPRLRYDSRCSKRMICHAHPCAHLHRKN